MFSIEGVYLQHYATTQSGFAEAIAFDRPTLQLTGVTAVYFDSLYKIMIIKCSLLVVLRFPRVGRLRDLRSTDFNSVVFGV